LNEWAERDEPDEPPGDVRIIIEVPEEFVGVSLGELNAREGRINGMEAEETTVTIIATLPASAYDALIKAIGMDTDGRGRVALAES
jgi:translation elongation factor EF-G